MPEQENSRQKLVKAFNDLSSSYDTLWFLQVCADRLVAQMPIPVGARVLDAATGTGVVALAAAKAAGPGGRVVGVDLSEEMLARARQKAGDAGMGWVEFITGDATRLDFADGSFDFVFCSSALFFMPDMLAAVKEWRRVLRPGGWLEICTFSDTFLQPLRDMWVDCERRNGVKPAYLPIDRLQEPAACRNLLDTAGFTQVEARFEKSEYFLNAPEDRWVDITAGLEGAPLKSLDAERTMRIKMEHLAELAALVTPRGIRVDCSAIYTLGQNPG